jgi:hypothetical protein
MSKNISVIDDLIEQMKDAGPSFKVSPSQDLVKFGFPEDMTQPMSKQLQQAMISPGQGKGRLDVKVHKNDKQFSDTNKQLQLHPSSTIQQAAYWPQKEYLVVSFRSGSSYSYSGVELLQVLLWEQASSAGSWFYYNIRTSYAYRKLG